MQLSFVILPASKCSKKDVITALDIYCKNVDIGSFTNTNEIKDYIFNESSHKNEQRKMFFYLMYDQNSKVIGFSEYAYLPASQTVVLDYLCTQQRNHVLFYNFYHMVLNDISDKLKKSGQFIRYIITELSQRKSNGVLIDEDSNYFRYLLSNENYRLLKFPYYQPSLLKTDKPEEFNIAIKFIGGDKNGGTIITKEQYFNIIEELYFSHYLAWYHYDNKTLEQLKSLIIRIKKETPKNETSSNISLVQCSLFDVGQCPKMNTENITITRNVKKRIKRIVFIIIFCLFSVATLVTCIIPCMNNIASVICSTITIISGSITIFLSRRELFGAE